MAGRSWQPSEGAVNADDRIDPRKESGNANPAFRGTVPVGRRILRRAEDGSSQGVGD